MNFLLKASLFLVPFFSFDLAKAEEVPQLIIPNKDSIPAGFSNVPPPVNTAKETALPESFPDDRNPVTLDEMIRQMTQDSQNKVLAAKTELIAGKKIYLIKVLTPVGHIQQIKIDATTGKPLDKLKE